MSAADSKKFISRKGKYLIITGDYFVLDYGSHSANLTINGFLLMTLMRTLTLLFMKRWGALDE